MSNYMLPTMSAWDEPGALEGFDFFWIGDTGPLMRMVDGPVSTIMEIPKEMVWQNIRGIFQRLGIRVYVFHDRVEIRGSIPTEVMDIPHGTDHIKRGAIICSRRGLGGWVTKQSLDHVQGYCYTSD